MPEVSIITPVRATKPSHLSWLNETIASVADQTAIQECEMVVVDDHSTLDLGPIQSQWNRIRWLEAEGEGVSAARNQAAQAAYAELLLPLDADDKLNPDAVQLFLWGWNNGGKKEGSVYSDIIMFGQDYQQAYLAPPVYDFSYLLRKNFMLVGCLHRKSDWKRIGGWREDMEQGLEDWEYWITMGENGVCGFHVNGYLYWYRRNPIGRLAKLRSAPELMQAAKLRMRDLHIESYNGRFKMGCCGGAAVSTRSGVTQATLIPVGGDRVLIRYTGNREGSFNVTGPSGAMYVICGRNAIVEDLNGKPGVLTEDAALFGSFNQGRDFQRVITQSAPVEAVPKESAQPEAAFSPITGTDRAENVAIDMGESGSVVSQEEAMRGLKSAGGIPNPTTYKVADIQKMDLSPQVASVMLAIEKANKNRKMVVSHLESIIGE